MFLTLLLKEMHETVVTFRFFFVTVLCLVLIPLGMYVTERDYEYRLDDYRESLRLYNERDLKGYGGVQAEGYRSPAPLSLFATGLDELIPNRIVTSRDNKYTITNQRGLNNPRSRIAGPFDFVFIVGTVLSVFAFIYTFGAIAGEKEKGTLRLVLAGAVPRPVLLFAKLVGEYITFIIPFLTGTIAGIVLIILTGGGQIFTSALIPAIGFIIAISTLFLFSMFALGLWVSTLAGTSVTALVVLLVVWVAFSLVIPKTSPLIAQAIIPVKSEEILNTEKQALRRQNGIDKDSRLSELLAEMMRTQGITNFNPFDKDPVIAAAVREYDDSPRRKAIDEEYTTQLNDALHKLDLERENAEHRQDTVSSLIARLSPVTCYMNVMTETAGTGVTAIGIMEEQAEQYYETVKSNVYDKFITKKYNTAGGSMYSTTVRTDGNPQNEPLPLPDFPVYQHTPLNRALAASMPDLAILSMYTVLFFSLAFVSFLRYDVR